VSKKNAPSCDGHARLYHGSDRHLSRQQQVADAAINGPNVFAAFRNGIVLFVWPSASTQANGFIRWAKSMAEENLSVLY
jgi:hypothetical protein